MRKDILQLKAKQAEKFFLESESYCNFDLPDYFDFESFLKQISKSVGKYDVKNAAESSTSHVVYNNKDGKYYNFYYTLIK